MRVKIVRKREFHLKSNETERTFQYLFRLDSERATRKRVALELH